MRITLLICFCLLTTLLFSQEEVKMNSFFDLKFHLGQSKFFQYEKSYLPQNNLFGIDSIDLRFEHLNSLEIAANYNKAIFKNVYISPGLAFGTHRFRPDLLFADTTNNQRILIFPREIFSFEETRLKYIAARLGAKFQIPIFESHFLFINIGVKGNLYFRDNISIDASILSNFLNETTDVELDLGINSFIISYEYGFGYTYIFDGSDNQAIILGVLRNSSNKNLIDGNFTLDSIDKVRQGKVSKKEGLVSVYLGYQWCF